MVVINPLGNLNAINNSGAATVSPSGGTGLFSGTAGQINPSNPEYIPLVNDLFQSVDLSAQDFGQAASESALATGDTQEAGAYGSVQSIANANATLALAAGQVQQAQTGLQIRKTIGTQQADIAANGFGNSGSALALMRSSTRQGTLQQQVEGVNSQLEAGSFQEQGQAAVAEGAAATAAANSATALGTSENAIAQASKTNAINEASTLGLNTSSLSQLSGTTVPTVNPWSMATPTGNVTGMGGQPLLQGEQFVI